MTCNDTRGTVYLDQQVVACYCPACDARVASGHDRPLFSFTRFERHSGSKAKKWRISLRIDPGSVPEVPEGDPPMALGQWLEAKGVMSWAPRGAGRGGGQNSDDDGGDDSPYALGGRNGVGAAYQRQAVVAPLADRHPFGGGGGDNGGASRKVGGVGALHPARGPEEQRPAERCSRTWI